MRTTGAHDRRAVTHIIHIVKMFPNVCSVFLLPRAAFRRLFYCWQHQPNAVWLVEAIAVTQDAARYTAATTAQRARERARDIRA